MQNKNRAVWGYIFIILISIHSIPTPCPATPLDIKVRDQHLWIDANEARLDTILTEIARQMRIRIVFYGKGDRKVSAAMKNRAVEQGLKELLSRTDFSFVYAQDPEGDPGETILKEVVIITADSKKDPISFEPPPAEPIQTDNPVPTSVSGPAAPEMSVTEPEAKQPDRVPETVYGEGVSRKLGKTQAGRMAAMDLFASVDAAPAALDEKLNRKAGVKTGGDQFGLEIGAVDQGTGLDHLGLEQGDVIRDINGEKVTNPDEANNALQKGLDTENGGMLRIEVERDGMIESIYVEIK